MKLTYPCEISWAYNYPINVPDVKNTEPLSTADLTKRAVKILDEKYEKADLNGIVEKCDHLNAEPKESLLQTFKT